MTLLLLGFSLSLQAEKTDTIHKSDTSAAKADPLTDTGKSIIDSSTDDVPDSVKSAKKQDLKDTVHYEADNIAYDADGRVLQLTGHAKVRYQNMNLFADTIVYTIDDNLFTAMGKPSLVEDADTTIGDFMVYNIKTKRGRVRTATTHIQGAYFTGQRILKTKENELYVAQGEYTTCAYPDEPHFFFYGERIRLKPNDKIISKPVVLNIGNAPVLALPYFIFPVEHNRKSGLLTPVWGGNPAGGGYIDNLGYYWTPNDYFDLTSSFRVREFSEYIAQASSRYVVRNLLDGGFSANYTFNSDFRNSSRQWSLDYSHTQKITPDGLTTLAGRGNLVSTKNFYSNYSLETSQLSEQLLTSNMALSKQFQDIKANGSLVWAQTHNLRDGHLTSDMPSVNFNLSQRPLIPLPDQNDDLFSSSQTADTTSHWYNSIYWGYGGQGIVKRDAYTDSDKKGFLKPGAANSISISAPQKLFNYITITPNASANLTTFYGYIDTAVKHYDSAYTDTTYTVKVLSDTAKYPGYHTVSKTDTILAGQPDSIHVIKARSLQPARYAVHDTFNNTLTNVAGWRTGVSLSTNLYGTFPIRLLNFLGMRHTLSPSVSYDFVPNHDLDKMFYPIGISPEPSHKRSQNISFSLGNLFEGKLAESAASSTLSGSPKTPAEKSKEKKFTILRADVRSSYNFEATERKWGDLSFSASTGSTYGVSFSSSFWMYDNAGKQTLPLLSNYSITPKTPYFSAHGKLWDGDRLLLDSLRKVDPLRDINAGPQTWNIAINPSFSFSASRSKPGEIMVPVKHFNLNASADFGLTRNWKFSWNGNYSPELNQMVGNSINISCDLECWELRLHEDMGALNPNFYFIISVKKIPEIKWEQRSRY